MAVIYLQHPVHGHKVACSDFEADYDEQNGWERYDPNEAVVEEIADEAQEDVAPTNVLEVKSRRRKSAE